MPGITPRAAVVATALLAVLPATHNHRYLPSCLYYAYRRDASLLAMCHRIIYILRAPISSAFAACLRRCLR